MKLVILFIGVYFRKILLVFIVIFLSDPLSAMFEADMLQPRNADSKYPWEREENMFGGKIKIKSESGRRTRAGWTPNRVEFLFVGNAFLEELMYAYFPIDSFSIPWEYYPARVTLKG